MKLVIAVNFENGHVMSRAMPREMSPQELADFMASENAGVYADELLVVENGSDGPNVNQVFRLGVEF